MRFEGRKKPKRPWSLVSREAPSRKKAKNISKRFRRKIWRVTRVMMLKCGSRSLLVAQKREPGMLARSERRETRVFGS